MMLSDDNTVVNNVSSETGIITYRRRSRVKPLEYYSRRRSNNNRQRRKGLGLLIMNSLSTQNGVDNATEDTCLAESIEAPSLLSSKDMCQNEVTAGDGASLIIVETMTLEKPIDDCSDCGHVAARSVNNIKFNLENVSFDNEVEIQEENVEMVQCERPNDISYEVCDILVPKETPNEPTCSQGNKAPLDVSVSVTFGASGLEVDQTKQDVVRMTSPSLSETNPSLEVDQTKQDVVRITSPLLSETNPSLEEDQTKQDVVRITSPSVSETNVLNDVITEFRNADTILSLTKASNGSSSKKLIVLDVNGLLADIVPVAQVSDRSKPDTIISGKAVFRRPFCDEFLKFCFQRFNVGIWSSRIKRNVDSIVDFLMGKLRHNLLFCWDQSHCTGTGFNTVENSSKPLVLKELKKLWEKSEPDLPWERGEYNESNTLLLDDSPYKALCNPPDTAIFPNTYQYTDENDNSLGPGGDLYGYLEGLVEAADVQTYVKQNPFGQRPITEEDASWDFYLKVKEYTMSIPSQLSESLVKMKNVVFEADMTSVTGSLNMLRTTNSLGDVEADAARGSSKNEDQNNMSGRFKVDEYGDLPRENTRDYAASDSPNCFWRCRERGRSESGSRSPVRGRSWIRSRSREWNPWGQRERCRQSPSFSHERERSRSKSPSHRYGGEFGGDKRRRDKALPPECFAFIRGKCYRGASCRYLHQECDETGRSGSYRFQQQFQNVPPSWKRSDIYGETETIPPERSAHERSQHMTQDLDHNILVMEEKEGTVGGFGKFSRQRSDNMRRGKALLEECRNFMQGRCYKGAYCRYLHQESDKIDRSRSYWSKEQYEDVPPGSKSCIMYGETGTVPPKGAKHEHSGCENQDPDQETLVMEERKGMKEELGMFTTQPWGAMRRDKIPCRHFMQGKCYRGVSCWFLHSDKFDSSGSSWSKQQYQDVPPSSKSSDIYRETETVTPQGAVLEHTEQDTQDLDQDILVMDERNGMGKELGKSTPQPGGGTRGDKVVLEECRDFIRGKCYRGAYCRYLHQEFDKVDRSRSCWSKHQYQDVPHSSKSFDTYVETETVPCGSSVHEHNESKTKDSDQDTMFMENRGTRDELFKYNSQLCDKIKSDEICRKFMRGNCHRGTFCRYLHQESDKTRRDEFCRKFMRGMCYRGASCRYLHDQPDSISRSRSYWSQQQYGDDRHSSKRSDIYGESETIATERSVHEHAECEAQDLVGKFATQHWDKMRRDEVCRKFQQGRCYRGASCRYVHDEMYKIDGSRSYWSEQLNQDVPYSSKSQYIYWETKTDTSVAYRSKQQYQSAPFNSKRSDICGEIASTPHERSFCEHNEFKTEDLKQNISDMEERNCMKEELARSTTQPCDGQSGLEPSVAPLAEDGKVSDDVANCVPAHVEGSMVEHTENTANDDQFMT